MIFIPSDVFFHSYVWLLWLQSSSHTTPKIAQNLRYIYIYICIELGKKAKRLRFRHDKPVLWLTHSSGDFNDRNICNYLSVNYKNLHDRCGGKFSFFVQLLCSNALFLWRHEDTSSLRLLSDDNSVRQMISTFSLRQRLYLLLARF